MSKLTSLNRRFKIGQGVPVLTEDGEHLKAEVMSAKNVPTGGHPQRWQIGIPREVAEACLAHTVADATEAAYARSDLLARRRDTMEAWGKYITA